MGMKLENGSYWTRYLAYSKHKKEARIGRLFVAIFIVVSLLSGIVLILFCCALNKVMRINVDFCREFLFLVFLVDS